MARTHEIPVSHEAPLAERRRTPRGRRARDRLYTAETRKNPSLGNLKELKNLLLLVEDDLRESALAMGAVESYLCRAQDALAKERPPRAELYRLAEDAEVVTRLDLLVETLLSLRKRMGLIADTLP